MLSRRRFLRVAGAVSGAALAAGAGTWWAAKRSAAGFYRRLVELPPAAEGPLADRELGALMATTHALVGTEIDDERYADFFRWHAENVPGYRGLYARCASTLDERARAAGRRAFADCDPLIQKKILGRAHQVRDAINDNDRLKSLHLAIFDKDWFLYERYVVREILTLFARTDAWILAGYGQPPGVPRGLDAYREAPSRSLE